MRTVFFLRWGDWLERAKRGFFWGAGNILCLDLNNGYRHAYIFQYSLSCTPKISGFTLCILYFNKVLLEENKNNSESFYSSEPVALCTRMAHGDSLESMCPALHTIICIKVPLTVGGDQGNIMSSCQRQPGGGVVPQSQLLTKETQF